MAGDLDHRWRSQHPQVRRVPIEPARGRADAAEILEQHGMTDEPCHKPLPRRDRRRRQGDLRCQEWGARIQSSFDTVPSTHRYAAMI